MKSEQEISKRAANSLEFIIKCPSGCGGKLPGFYCNYCHVLDGEVQLLAWVLNKEEAMTHAKAPATQ